MIILAVQMFSTLHVGVAADINKEPQIMMQAREKWISIHCTNDIPSNWKYLDPPKMDLIIRVKVVKGKVVKMYACKNVYAESYINNNNIKLEDGVYKIRFVFRKDLPVDACCIEIFKICTK